MHEGVWSREITAYIDELRGKGGQYLSLKLTITLIFILIVFIL